MTEAMGRAVGNDEAGLRATVDAMRAAFLAGPPPDLVARQARLRMLRRAVQARSRDLVRAAAEDFGQRRAEETLILDLGPVGAHREGVGGAIVVDATAANAAAPYGETNACTRARRTSGCVRSRRHVRISALSTLGSSSTSSRLYMAIRFRSPQRRPRCCQVRRLATTT